MRTVKGFEAIEIADQYNVALYDVDFKSEMTVTQAKQFIDSRRDPQSFVIQNWPDTDSEAEQIVLNQFHRVLKEQRLSDTRVVDLAAGISSGISSGMPIHLKAAEMAAQRLAQQDKLEIVETDKEYNLYRIPRIVYFTNQFLDDLCDRVCEECGQLNLDGPFHETCLMALIDFLANENFTVSDITEMRKAQHVNGRFTKIRPGIGMEWLSKTASATKTTWQTVLRPMFSRESEEVRESDEKAHIKEQNHLMEHLNEDEAGSATSAFRETGGTGRAIITKEELIDYLRSVQILDENGELIQLQKERMTLLEQIACQERETERIEKQRAFLEKQCEEMQRDMETLIQAMQITKRHGPDSGRVIDATFTTEQDS